MSEERGFHGCPEALAVVKRGGESIVNKIIDVLEKNQVYPAQFFNIKKDPIIENRHVLASASLFSYCVLVALFAALLATQLQQTTTETKITSSDVSGGGWQCSMLSTVSQSFPYLSSSGYSFSYGMRFEIASTPITTGRQGWLHKLSKY